VREAELERYRKAGITLDPTSDCTLAPSVADAYQDQGLGSLMMRYLISIAQRLGCQRMVLLSGTHETNPRAIHFYLKHGFTKIGTFEKPPGFDNYDMMLKLR
jgi:ribosomal protein S18 acetylase RimI-like enzyme